MNGNGVDTEEQDGSTCASLATGMKCLPQSKVPFAKGNVLHDSHAEVLAIRAFNRFLVDECAELAKRGLGSRSQWLRWRERGGQNAEEDNRIQGGERQQPFELQDDLNIHMYCSECPCGDASMELIMAEQVDSTPWNGSTPSSSDMLGRGHFDQLGVVRRKPARADAPLTLSKSCSDKLALKQVTGLLSGATSKLIWPGNVHLSSLVLPEDQVMPAAIERAWGRTGRMSQLNELDATAARRWEMAGYSFRPFSVQGTTRTFEYCKPAANKPMDEEKAVPSNLSSIYTPHASEALIYGVLQGRKQFDGSGASCISRRKMWQAVGDAAALARDAAEQEGERGLLSRMECLVSHVTDGSYSEMKLRSHVTQEVKQVVQENALKGWKRNEGDSDWKLD